VGGCESFNMFRPIHFGLRGYYSCYIQNWFLDVIVSFCLHFYGLKFVSCQMFF
jgi:hypothetical protein